MHPAESPLVAVVLPTFRRPQQLSSLLGALTQQSLGAGHWYLIVVDNDDPPGAEAVFAAHATQLPLGSRYIRAVDRGACYARNAGIAEATRDSSGERPDIIAFIDDDVVPDEGWLPNLIEPIVAKRCEAVAGAVSLDWQTPRPPWLSRSLDGYLAHFLPYPDEQPLGPDDVLLTASAAFRRELLEQTGGFDTALGPRDGTPLVNDDIDLLRRCIDAGARVHYVPRAHVLHELPASRLKPSYLVRRVYAQGRSDWLLERRVYAHQRLHGAGVGVRELRRQLNIRRREGLWRRAVAYRVVCDVARCLGFTREALRNKTVQ
jgi:GT2 family glycosyltransferase